MMISIDTKLRQMKVLQFKKKTGNEKEISKIDKE